ncbi:MAG: DUF3052 family protein [Bacteroidia bacterium]|nr:DUF3052 family protein [Bacteroidia bacterium]
MENAGYSGNPLHKKLGYKSGFVVRLVSIPEDYFDLIIDYPEDVNFTDDVNSPKDLIHFFTTDSEELEESMPRFSQEIKETGMIWVSWPKKSSGVPTTVSDSVIRNWARSNGLIDVKVCAVNATWSGLKLVIPVKKRNAPRKKGTVS